jgi:hypothetical protein
MLPCGLGTLNIEYSRIQALCQDKEQGVLPDLQLRHLPGPLHRLPRKKFKITERGIKKLVPPAGSHPLPRWARGPLSAP